MIRPPSARRPGQDIDIKSCRFWSLSTTTQRAFQRERSLCRQDARTAQTAVRQSAHSCAVRARDEQLCSAHQLPEKLVALGAITEPRELAANQGHHSKRP